MKYFNYALLFVFFINVSCGSYDIHIPDNEKEESVEEGTEYELVWAEEFDYEGLPDPYCWGYEQGYARNNELQDYRVKDQRYSRVEDGKLIIEAAKDDHWGTHKWTGEPYHFLYSSAELHYMGDVKFHYGRLDISAKIPIGKGIWPAIWMLPVDEKYGGWPHSGEIDIMEYVWGDNPGHNEIFATVHTTDTNVNGNTIPSGTVTSETLDTEFHLYSLVWEKTYLQILFDNKVIFNYERKQKGSTPETWPFDQPFFLILNIAVGGDWGGVWGIDESIFPVRMEIDYVRYYQKK
ncbi:glycoside hydrolase family 16 protein [uncultured Bacteroides sp.]|uniref:glycoside hydrolase family 16 protein n=1 Tax=uncultured Bacteroides sp. TaxID=162156 RepID=UPI0026115CA8|nr:glycoside hydrolase family 16 protein [uncultured Bacteroides sp.]